jgi:hypothetical protein
MFRRWLPGGLAGVLGLWLAGAAPAQDVLPYQVQPQPPAAAAAMAPQPAYQSLNHYFYYPYYYFPHNYWPTLGPKWPEPIGACYQRPPAYMAYPPYKDPNWRYEYWEPQRHYRGFHFWLDQF